VFFVCKNINIPMYIDLLEEWNQFSNDEIDKWLADKTFNKYNRQNFQMSGTYHQDWPVEYPQAEAPRPIWRTKNLCCHCAKMSSHRSLDWSQTHSQNSSHEHTRGIRWECGKHGGKDLSDLQAHLQNGLGQWDPSWLTWNLCMCVFEHKNNNI